MPPAQTVFLAPHIHMARCHDDLVVLDVRADAYGLLIDAAPQIRFGRRPGDLRVDGDILEDLQTLGLVAAVPSDSGRIAPPGLSGEIPPSPGPLPRPLILRAVGDSLRSTADFARTPFAGLIHRAALRRTADRSVDDEEIGRVVGAFQAVHPWIPFEGDCLQRGYRLHHHLHRAGIPARWVFGVRTWPFLAHCWVQVGDRVVGDTRERVGGFSPILAI